MTGHLFLIHGDLAHLACDALLISTSFRAQPNRKTWFTAEEWPASVPDKPQTPPGWESEERRVFRVEGWPPNRPAVWLANVGGTCTDSVDWFLEPVRQFVEEAHSYFKGAECFLKRRERALIALPVVGTGAGGAFDFAGKLLSELLPLLQSEAKRTRLDIALVAKNPDTYAAMQFARRQQEGHWEELSPILKSEARRLSREASRGQLVLFLGAGVSVGAGLPGWNGLLWELAKSHGLKKSEEGEFEGLSFLDKAVLLRKRMKSTEELGSFIANKLKAPYYALAHSLLAALPTKEHVTMNYDQLFETALQKANRQVSILPYKINSSADTWLLKLHGCISKPGEIVLTRGDYLRYASKRAALAGIVQALLITRHMLFVGFSLTDDNFHKIIDEVRQAMAHSCSTESRIFGTSLQLLSKPLLEELWSEDLHLVSMVKQQEEASKALSEEEQDAQDGRERTRAARQLEIFLDYLAAETSWTRRHLLGDRFQASLSVEEKELKELLKAFETALKGASQKARDSDLWREFNNFVAQFRNKS
jgi:hypothetical protein